MTVQAEVQPNGDLLVNEQIVWNFGANSKRGIFRYVPERFDLDNNLVKVPDPSRAWQRVTKVDWLNVSSPTGAPTDTSITTEGNNSVLRIGNPNVYISGRHTYQIRYRIERAVVDGLLQFVAVGEGWTVPVEDVSITVKVPIRPGARAVCLRGDSTRCELTQTADSVSLQTSGVGIEVEVPVADSIVARKPILETPHTVADGFTTSGAPGAVGGLAVVGAIVGALIAGRKGRDRVFASGASLGQPGDQERPRKFRERLASPVEFEPPEGIRPGLVDPARLGESSQRSISATVVDLAARGVLQIEPLGEKGSDYRLVLTGQTPVKTSQQITSNEQNLLNVLFAGSNDGSVTLDELSSRTQLASQMQSIRGLLLGEAVQRGWWVNNPVHVRARWRMAGIAVMVAGAVFTFLLAGASRFGLVGVAVLVFGLGVLAAAQYMPVRTATGSRIEARLRGFEQLFDAGEGDRLKLAERQNLFAEYLPYAMAFGNVDKWVKTFEKLGIQPAVPYFGPMGGGYGPAFFPGGWGRSGGLQGALDSFDRSLNESIAAGAAAEAARQAQSSRSSGGFGGGSFGGGGSSGGGGGGSW